MADFLQTSFKFPDKFGVYDFDRKVVMKGLKQATRIIRQDSKKLISKRRVSKEGEAPGLHTGRMKRAVKIHNARRKDRLWSRVQVDTIQGTLFYPAVLTHGTKDNTLKPRMNFIEHAATVNEKRIASIVEKAIDEGLIL